ncbi:nuclear transport factor 2 family protein [Amycolatopsis sp. cg5]|uniref:YybH family protein n=1 Tax=Amycolatopsis sp. cg5 TaxID=3238802 RepID=UPI00352549D7
MTQDETSIREIFDAHIAAMRAKDPDALVARFAPDAVTFTLAPPLRNSGPAVTDPAGVHAWLAGFTGEMDFEIRDLELAIGDEVAFGFSLNRLSATPQGDTEQFDLWFRATVGLRKIDGEWLITHEHMSTPFYMDGSFRSAVDLKP